ncbi:MAG: UDP-glucose/GDP-mannose dehydrogenase family protein [Ignavibacteria bacterium]|nr:UDP-glucose/GDP-mannose dehydrogenase family protein [Ignavibacteria bacterium]
MKIGIIGTGYVGLVTGTCFAESGNDVYCMDNNPKVVETLKKGISTIYEPQLEELIQKNIKENRLLFTNSLEETVEKTQIIFLCLPTPPNEDGSADLTHVLNVSENIAKLLKERKIIVAKSTVPVGTSDKIKDIFKKYSKHEINYAFNPEFLKEGAAVNDFMSPDRVVVGSKSETAIEAMEELYSAFMRTSDRFIVMDERSSEITKYAANSMLATRISFMNDIALLCEKVNADIDSVRLGMSTDSRIGDKFLFAGIGYGGSCFPKDVKALIKTGEECNVDFKILKAVEEININQRQLIFNKIKKHFESNLKGKTFAVWGLSYKPRTDDIREAPAITLIEMILDEGGYVNVCDPAAIERGKVYFKDKLDKVKFFEINYDSLKDTDAMILVTEWNEFRRPDFNRMKSLMKTPVIFDGRNIYNPDHLKRQGFIYYGIGK